MCTVPRFWFSSRFAMALLGFIGFLSMSSQRMCITVSLICMLNQTAMTDTAAAALTPEPGVSTAGPQINGSVVRGDNVTISGRAADATPPPPVKMCGEVPEIFVFNTSEFSRAHVSRVFSSVIVSCDTLYDMLQYISEYHGLY